MTILVIGSVLVGAILGRFFKVLVLLPVFALTLAVALVRTAYLGHDLLHLALEFAVLVTSLQIGYAASLFSGAISAMLQRVKDPAIAHPSRNDSMAGTKRSHARRSSRQPNDSRQGSVAATRHAQGRAWNDGRSAKSRS
jgi:hypothetical protein